MNNQRTKSKMRSVKQGAVVALIASFGATLIAMDNVPPEPAPRVPQTEMGITQLANEKLDWLLDAKFGMFIHWGLYSGPGQGEWFMENKGIMPEKYREYAYPESGESYFDAAGYHPRDWAQLAR